MKFRSERRVEPEINLTPLIDVVFLMLIFFMISTTFDRESQLAIQLPEAGGEAVEREARPLELVVNREGRYFVAGKELVDREPETLQRTLERLAGGDRAQPLVISADANTPYQAVVTAMDAAGRAGLNNLSLTTRQAGE
jgi:biopolymer transport protein ExbD